MQLTNLRWRRCKLKSEPEANEHAELSTFIETTLQPETIITELADDLADWLSDSLYYYYERNEYLLVTE